MTKTLSVPTFTNGNLINRRKIIASAVRKCEERGAITTQDTFYLDDVVSLGLITSYAARELRPSYA